VRAHISIVAFGRVQLLLQLLHLCNGVGVHTLYLCARLHGVPFDGQLYTM
jgi:hypothetical protein